MNNQEIQDAVCEVLGVALAQGRPVDPDFYSEEHPAWDSLKHIEVVLALEDRFNIRFAEAEMSNLDSVPKIARRIGELL